MVSNRFIAVFVAALAAASPASGQNAPQRQDPVAGTEKKLKWFDSYQAGISAAKAQKRPVLIKFEAEWCGWCKKLDSEVFAQPQIIKALEKYVCIRVDVDKQRNVALAYRVRSLPRIVIVNIHNEIVGDWLGYREAPAFSKLLREVWEYTLTRTDTTPVPAVRPDPSAPGQPWQATKIDAGDTNAVMDLLGHKKPTVRANAMAALVNSGEKSMPTVAAALESRYLGTRIAGWKVLRILKGSQFQFDPWAPGPERAQAVTKIKARLGLNQPKAAPQPATGT